MVRIRDGVLHVVVNAGDGRRLGLCGSSPSSDRSRASESLAAGPGRRCLGMLAAQAPSWASRRDRPRRGTRLGKSRRSTVDQVAARNV